MSPRRMVVAGAALGGFAVALGAFGAHGLRARVSPEMLQVFEVGVRYQFYHALALVLLGIHAALRVGGRGAAEPAGEEPRATGLESAAAWCFVFGVLAFSGSLYVLTLTGLRWLGAVTPLGGLAFIAGWICFAGAALWGGTSDL